MRTFGNRTGSVEKGDIAWVALKQNVQFQKFISLLEVRLGELRESYEDQEASEFIRGQVVAMRELIDEIKES